jgi:glycerate 2-kinase
MSTISAKGSSESSARAHLMRIYAAAVSAVAPGPAVARAFDGGLSEAAGVPSLINGVDGVRLLAVGKAALGMTVELQARLGTKLRAALAIAPGVSASVGAPTLAGVRLMTGAHPLPDASSEAAGRAALEFMASAEPGELALIALSGGASALMAVPADGLTLGDKIGITSGLLRAGASIRELNTVRKHLSAIKGGRLLRAISANCRVLSLILSDVPGNDLGTIGSGPVAGDATTYADAVAVLKRRGLWGRAPEAIRAHLERGAAGEIDETVKRGDAALERVTNVVIGDNDTAVRAAAETAAALGYQVVRVRELAGEADDLGRRLAGELASLDRDRVCVIAGVEPVVTIKGNGKGGRAQQCALALALELDSLKCNQRIVAFFAGTDGVDGPTDAAGATVTPTTVARAREAGIDAHTALARNDAYNIFSRLGDLIVTGPTGTNVSDIFVGLINY